jgi:hypothetical protein
MSPRQELSSGLWNGYYEQGGRQYPQQSRLEFADGIIRGDGRDDIGIFYIDGEYRFSQQGVRLGWIKTYDGAHSVLYVGQLRDIEIVGSWKLSGLTGRFAISPARDDSMEILR